MRKLALTIALLGASTSATAAYVEAESAHFKVYWDGSRQDAEKALTRLEGVHYLLGVATGVPGDTKTVKVKVYYVSDVDAVQKLYGRGGSNVAGFYNPASLGAYAVVPKSAGSSGSFSSELVLFHEYTHHFMLQYMKGIFPGWFVEGFAELFATASFEKKGMITFGKAAKHRETELRYAKWLPFQKILDGSYRKMKDISNAPFYGQSWLTAHYLLLSGNRQGQFRQYMANIQKGLPIDKATEAFGDLNTLAKELRVYYDRASFPYKTPALPANIAANITFRDLRAGEVALLMERARLQHFLEIPDPDDLGEKETQAEHEKHMADARDQRDKFIAALRTKVATMPNDPDAVELLADAECLAENKAECVAAADKFLAMAPNSPRAYTLKATAQILQGTDWAAARKNLGKAVELDADNAPAKATYFKSFIKEGKKPTDAAMVALFQALQLMPQVDEYRLSLGVAFMERGDKERAIAALSPLAFAPHDSGKQKKAAALLAKLKGEPDQAVTATAPNL